MREADDPLAVDEDLRRHAPPPEQLDLLPEEVEDAVLGIGQADEGEALGLPSPLEGRGAVRAEDHDLGPALRQLAVLLAQLRQVPAAVRSEEAAVEDEQDVRDALEARERERLALEVGEREVRRGFVDRNR